MKIKFEWDKREEYDSDNMPLFIKSGRLPKTNTSEKQTYLCDINELQDK
jgi:hypothetical protein